MDKFMDKFKVGCECHSLVYHEPLFYSHFFDPAIFAVPFWWWLGLPVDSPYFMCEECGFHLILVRVKSWMVL